MQLRRTGVCVELMGLVSVCFCVCRESQFFKASSNSRLKHPYVQPYFANANSLNSLHRTLETRKPTFILAEDSRILPKFLEFFLILQPLSSILSFKTPFTRKNLEPHMDFNPS